jgi:hypothetical protein
MIMELISENSERSLFLNKLKLSWIASRNIKLLTTNPNHRLLYDVWNSMKEELSFIFNRTENSFEKIGIAFKTFDVTMDPRVSTEFDPTPCKLKMNLLLLLFCESSFGEIAFNLGFLMAGSLVHEYDHYNFLYKHKLLRAPKETQDEFAEQFGSEMEKSAFEKEILFLRKCEEVLPKNIQLYIPKSVEWSSDGTPQKYNISVNLGNRFETIGQNINRFENVIRSYLDQTNKKAYDRESELNAIKTHMMILKKLGLRLKIRQPKSYPVIEVQF